MVSSCAWSDMRLTEAAKDDRSQMGSGRTADGWHRVMRELTRQETCWGVCKASQRMGYGEWRIWSEKVGLRLGAWNAGQEITGDCEV